MRDRQRQLAAHVLTESSGSIRPNEHRHGAATQMACSWDRDANVARAEKLIREAAARGAQVILVQELFETPYFCKDHSSRHLQLAKPWTLIRRSNIFALWRANSRWCCRSASSNAPITHFIILWCWWMPTGRYSGATASRTSGGAGLHEKFYFSPGDTGFKVFETRYAKLGVAICWDQWFRKPRAPWR